MKKLYYIARIDTYLNIQYISSISKMMDNVLELMYKVVMTGGEEYEINRDEKEGLLDFFEIHMIKVKHPQYVDGVEDDEEDDEASYEVNIDISDEEKEEASDDR